MQNFINEIKEQAIEYGSIPFWSWNDKLDPEELKRQIHVMHDLGMKGFFMHARGGLETEYMSDEWFDCIRTCVEEAKTLDMKAWSYDENGWPSGFAGGKLLEDKANWATYIKYETYAEFPTDDNILGVYVIQDGICRRVTSPESGVTEYGAVIQAWDSSYVDTMDPDIIAKFIHETHEKYEKEVGFSKYMPGFFTDEPQYYRWATPWSETIPKKFAERYGYDVLDGLAAMFVDYEGAEEFRWDYYRLCHELFTNSYAKQIYEWCEEHGCQLTGHAIEEGCLDGMMVGGAGIMPFYEYEHIPGVDYLGRMADNDFVPRQLGSACAQLGKKKAISEMFGACGWDVTPRELKRIAELQYVNGVNMMCQHLYSYSMRGQRKRDWPCHYSEHLPWQKAMASFNNYFNNLGYILSRGEEMVRTLVIHPIHSAYLTFKRKNSPHGAKELDADLRALNDQFSEHQIPYHFGDECMMGKMASVEGDRIKVGLCTYDYVVIPSMDTLDTNTVKLLKTYLDNGGKVYLFGKVPSRIDGRKADLSWLKGNCTFEDLQNTAQSVIRKDNKNIPQLRQMARNTQYGRVIFITNITEKQIDNAKITVQNCRGLYSLNLDTLEYTLLPGEKEQDGSYSVTLSFEDAESYLLMDAEESLSASDIIEENSEPIRLPNELTLSQPVNNMITLDYAQISYDGINFERNRPIILVKDMLLRAKYSGAIYLKYAFDIEEMPQSLHIAAEPMKYKSVTINGQPIALDGDWWFDRNFITADIAPFVQKGHNEVIMQMDYFQRDYVYYVLYGGVSETLRNCLSFDTEIESIYLFGNFCVKTDPEKMEMVQENVYSYTGSFRLVPQKDTVDFKNIVTDGYPFFAGAIEGKTVYNYKKGDPAELYINGRYAVCEVIVNGTYAGRVLFKQHLNLSQFLTEGDNLIEIKMYNSNRNLLGPHHYIEEEPLGTPPILFSMESMWESEQCSAYRDRYSFVRFGIDFTK